MEHSAQGVAAEMGACNCSGEAKVTLLAATHRGDQECGPGTVKWNILLRNQLLRDFRVLEYVESGRVSQSDMFKMDPPFSSDWNSAEMQRWKATSSALTAKRLGGFEGLEDQRQDKKAKKVKKRHWHLLRWLWFLEPRSFLNKLFCFRFYSCCFMILGECPKLCRGASSCLMPVCHSQVLKTDHSSHIQWVLFLRRNALAHRSLLLSDMFLILWCMLLCSVSFVQNAGEYNHWNPVRVWEERPLWSKTSFADASLGSM